jgi:hypothetical protein
MVEVVEADLAMMMFRMSDVELMQECVAGDNALILPAIEFLLLMEGREVMAMLDTGSSKTLIQLQFCEMHGLEVLHTRGTFS